MDVQYCERIMNHPSFLYILIGKGERGAAIYSNVQRYMEIQEQGLYSFNEFVEAEKLMTMLQERSH